MERIIIEPKRGNKQAKVIQSGPYAGMTQAQKRAAKKENRLKQGNYKTNSDIRLLTREISDIANKSVVYKNRLNPGGEEKRLVEVVSELVQAILLQDKPYVLPRYCGAFVAPHQYRWELPITLDNAVKFKTSLLLTNNLDSVVAIGQQETTNVNISAQTLNTAPGVSATFPGLEQISIDYTMKLGNGKDFKASTITHVPGFKHWSNSKSAFVPGFKFYHANLAGAVGGSISIGMNNISNSQFGSMTVVAGVVNKALELTPIITSVVANANGLMAYDLSGDANWNAWQDAAADDVTNLGFYFSYFINADAFEGYGNYNYYNQTNEVGLLVPISWRKYSLWELLSEGDIAKSQYLRAARHNVTGNAFVLSNNTPALAKGGSIYAARLPGNTYTEIGGTTDDIIRLVSCQVDHALRSSDLERGMAYSFSPEKIQDWLFERTKLNDPSQGDPENLPYCAVAIDASALDGATKPTFVLQGTCSVEYLTTDPSNWKVSSPSQAAIFDAVMNALAVENCVSHNPDHIQHMKNVVKRVMASDNLKYAIRTIIATGVKVAPFVLSML